MEEFDSKRTTKPPIRGNATVWRHLDPLLQVTGGVLGVCLLALGVVAVFESDNDAAVAALIAAGTVLVVVGVLGRRIESLRWREIELTLRRQADEAIERGDLERAEQYRELARVLSEQAAPFAATYEDLRRVMPYGPERTARLEEELARAKHEARSRTTSYSPDEVLNLFKEGSEGERIFAIGLMQEEPALADPEVALDAIRRSRSAFEQYHGLELARRLMKSLDGGTRRELLAAIREEMESGQHFRPGGDRWEISSRILEEWAV
jgi:hypothetical protein